MKSSITKGIAGMALAGAGLLGGVNIANDQVDTLKTERDDAINSKQNVVDLYVYSQISSGRIPTIDSSISLESVQDAYIRMVGANISLDDTNLFDVGKRISKDRGDYICK